MDARTEGREERRPARRSEAESTAPLPRVRASRRRRSNDGTVRVRKPTYDDAPPRRPAAKEGVARENVRKASRADVTTPRQRPAKAQANTTRRQPTAGGQPEAAKRQAEKRAPQTKRPPVNRDASQSQQPVRGERPDRPSGAPIRDASEARPKKTPVRGASKARTQKAPAQGTPKARTQKAPSQGTPKARTQTSTRPSGTARKDLAQQERPASRQHPRKAVPKGGPKRSAAQGSVDAPVRQAPQSQAPQRQAPQVRKERPVPKAHPRARAQSPQASEPRTAPVYPEHPSYPEYPSSGTRTKKKPIRGQSKPRTKTRARDLGMGFYEPTPSTRTSPQPLPKARKRPATYDDLDATQPNVASQRAGKRPAQGHRRKKKFRAPWVEERPLPATRRSRYDEDVTPRVSPVVPEQEPEARPHRPLEPYLVPDAEFEVLTPMPLIGADTQPESDESAPQPEPSGPTTDQLETPAAEIAPSEEATAEPAEAYEGVVEEPEPTPEPEPEPETTPEPEPEPETAEPEPTESAPEPEVTLEPSEPEPEPTEPGPADEIELAPVAEFEPIEPDEGEQAQRRAPSPQALPTVEETEEELGQALGEEFVENSSSTSGDASSVTPQEPLPKDALATEESGDEQSHGMAAFLAKHRRGKQTTEQPREAKKSWRQKRLERKARKQQQPSHLVATTKRRPKVFWAIYTVLVLVLAGLVAGVLYYTNDSLVRYEDSQPEAYMQHFVDDLRNNDRAARKRRDQALSNVELGTYDSMALINDRFDAGLGKKDYRIEQASSGSQTDSPVYTVYADDEPYLTLHLEPTSSYVRMGLLSITDWGIKHTLVHSPELPDDATSKVDEGLSYEISVADSSKVTVNGFELGAKDLDGEGKVLKGFEYASQFVDPPEAVTYDLDGLITDPEVKVTDFEGKEVEMARDGYTYMAKELFTPNRKPEELPVDVLEIAETWSKLMTCDLAGLNYGIDQVTAFLIPGSELYDQATTFVNSVDITFVVAHSITGFTEEQVSNCIMYNDRLFSCDVHFVKNMFLASGVDRDDEFSNTLIFAYVDDDTVEQPGWYLVNMQAIV